MESSSNLSGELLVVRLRQGFRAGSSSPGQIQRATVARFRKYAALFVEDQAGMDISSWDMVRQELDDRYIGREIQKPNKISLEGHCPIRSWSRRGRSDRPGADGESCAATLCRTLSCLGSPIRSLVMDLSGHQ